MSRRVAIAAVLAGGAVFAGGCGGEDRLAPGVYRGLTDQRLPVEVHVPEHGRASVSFSTVAVCSPTRRATEALESGGPRRVAAVEGGGVSWSRSSEPLDDERGSLQRRRVAITAWLRGGALRGTVQTQHTYSAAERAPAESCATAPITFTARIGPPPRPPAPAPRPGAIVEIAVIGTPDAVAVDGGRVRVLDQNGPGGLSRIDPGKRQATAGGPARIEGDGYGPLSAASGPFRRGFLAITPTGPAIVRSPERAFHEVYRTQLGSDAMTVARGAVWAPDSFGGVLRVDVAGRTQRRATRIPAPLPRPGCSRDDALGPSATLVGTSRVLWVAAAHFERCDQPSGRVRVVPHERGRASLMRIDAAARRPVALREPYAWLTVTRSGQLWGIRSPWRYADEFAASGLLPTIGDSGMDPEDFTARAVTLDQLDSRTGAVVRSRPLGRATVVGVSADTSALWVTQNAPGGRGVVRRYDLRRGTLRTVVRTEGRASPPAVGAGAVWVVDRGARTVLRLPR